MSMRAFAASPRVSTRRDWLTHLCQLSALRPGTSARPAPAAGEHDSVDGESAGTGVGRDPSAAHALLDALYQQHARTVLAYLYHHLPDLRDAEDALAEVFLAALRACAAGEAPRLPWLMLVARRRVADFSDFYRAHARMRALVIAPAEQHEPADMRDDPERLALRAEERRELLALLAALPAEQREVLVLRFAAGLPSARIAEILGKSDEATRALLSRALRHLRKEWQA